MKNQIIMAAVLVGVATGVGGFFAGTKFQQNRQPTFNRQFSNSANGGRVLGSGNGGRNGMGFRPVNGEVISTDDKSITVKLVDSSSKIILFSDKTVISKAETGSKDDLKQGTKVAVFGTDNADGSVTAQNIQLNPLERGIMGQPQASPTPISN